MDRGTTPARVLVIDDDEGVRSFIARGLTRAGFTVVSANGGVAGIAQLSSSPFDAVVCDLNMPDKDGLDVLSFAATQSPRPIFIVLTGFGSISVAVEAMKRGASDFIEKPAAIDQIRAAIISGINKKNPAPDKIAPKGLVGSPEWLDPFLAQLRRIAQKDARVLIEGETGTGKSAVAREIWRQSTRANNAFVELNCAAIPDTLLESELFGHKKGAFSGAIADYVGHVEQATHGTLFLDEIGELKKELQSKLLHVVQEGTFSPIGGKPIQVDVRFISATNKNLEAEVAAGGFRMDLYHRLNVVSLTIPPLRERPNDVPLLVDRFRAQLADKQRETPPEFAPETIEVMTRYSWSGNVRELENLVERMAVIHEPGTVILPSHLPARMRDEAGVSSSRQSTPAVPAVPAMPAMPAMSFPENMPVTEQATQYVKQKIVEALEASGGNRSKAARALGMKRTTLIEKMKKMGITGDDGSET